MSRENSHLLEIAVEHLNDSVLTVHISLVILRQNLDVFPEALHLRRKNHKVIVVSCLSITNNCTASFDKKKTSRIQRGSFLPHGMQGVA